MSGWTNRGKYKALGWALRGETPPTNLYVALLTSAQAPGADTNVKSELTECTDGNGYTTGGIQLSLNSTDFDVWTEDDGNDRALLQIKDLVWTASGGDMPSTAARYAALTDDNATQADREIYAYWDLGSDRQVGDGQTLTLQDLELRLGEPA